MTGMFRRDKKTVPIDDIVAAGQRDWDGRVKLAMASESAWKRATFGCLGVIVLLAGGMTYQAVHVAPPTMIHVVHSSLGGVIAGVSHNRGVRGSEPDPDQSRRRAMDHQLPHGLCRYQRDAPQPRCLREHGRARLAGGYRHGPLLQHATQGGAVCPGADRDRDGRMLLLFRRQPAMSASTRPGLSPGSSASPVCDGSVETIKPWAANVTLTSRRRRRPRRAQRNPNGLHVVAWSWTEK